MGAGQAAGSALDRVNYVLDWSNPLAATLDEVIKGILKQCGADDWFDWVTGDSELLEKTAQEWRSAARDLRDVVADLVAERKSVERVWESEAAQGFSRTMTDFEQALLDEADDMDTVAELLEMAAAACTIAEQAMTDLLVEIVEALMVTAATTAILSVLTAGAAAAIGPLAGAANVAYRAAKATRIAAKLADKLADIARQTQALAKLSRLRRYLRGLDRAKIKEWKGAKWKIVGSLRRGEVPAAGDIAQYLAWKQGKNLAKGMLGVDPGGAVTGSVAENGPGLAEEAYEYGRRPPSQSFDERMGPGPDQAEKSVREAFG
ncbi:WXG100 family type VII secretion target [Streptomyces sp. NPDC018019]|uniref:WXG100 family type VII secretion target n=1 Tax=Streptomyces sp. NPDC018019 TaxID=3365030 RepID=UPI0037BA4EB3